MIADGIVAGSGVVLFTTPGCPNCPLVRTRSQTVAQESAAIDFAEISAPDRPDLVASLAVRGAPTTIAFHAGSEIARVVGPASLGELRSLFQSAGDATPSGRATIARETRQIRTGAGAALVLAGLVAQNTWLVLIGAALILAGWHDHLTPKSF